MRFILLTFIVLLLISGCKDKEEQGNKGFELSGYFKDMGSSRVALVRRGGPVIISDEERKMMSVAEITSSVLSAGRVRIDTVVVDATGYFVLHDTASTESIYEIECDHYIFPFINDQKRIQLKLDGLNVKSNSSATNSLYSLEAKIDSIRNTDNISKLLLAYIDTVKRPGLALYVLDRAENDVDAKTLSKPAQRLSQRFLGDKKLEAKSKAIQERVYNQ